MHSLRSLVLAVPVAAGLAVPFATPAEAHRRHDGGAALVAGLIGLGVGAVAGNALAARSDGYGPAYAEPGYAPPPAYGYAPAYVAPPVAYAPVYAPPPVVYAAPPPVAYVPPPVYAVPRPVYAPPPAYRDVPTYAGWGEDD
jgi:hypothetical protein